MAFIQQGPRRPRQVSRLQHDPLASTSITGTATSYHSLQSSSASSRATATQEWSIVFPGRTKSDHQATINDAAQTVTPSHDGTGTFWGAESTTGSGSLISAASSSDQIDLSRVQSPGFDDDDEVSLFIEGYVEEGSSSSSSGRPPSLLSSANEGNSVGAKYPRHLARRGSDAGRSSSPSAQDLRSPTLSHLSFDDDGAPRPAWSWEQDGDTRVLASTTPRQQSPSRSTMPFRSSVIYASDSEADEEEVVGILQQRGRVYALPTIEDTQYEDALGSATFAMSAGLLPRRSPLKLQANTTRDHASSIFSDSQASAGFKRRHRRQHDGESVRSSKSRRNENTLALPDAVSIFRRRNGKATSSPRLSSTSERLAEARQRRPKEPAAGSASPPSLSKKEKFAKLFGRLFDVDAEVYDSLIHDKRPLTLLEEDQWGRSRQFPSIGFEYEQLELGENAGLGDKRWKELIDGRIVEDLEGEESSDSFGVGEEIDKHEEKRIEREVGTSLDFNPFNPVSALSKADWSSVKLPFASISMTGDGRPADLTLQDVIRHTTSRSANASQFPSEDVSSALDQVNPALPAILSSTAGALQEVMPYFVPFSWRLLMRLVREWRSEEGRRDKRPLQQHHPLVSEAGEVVRRTSDLKTQAERCERAEEQKRQRGTSSGSNNGRGRSRERKDLHDSLASSWSLAASSTTATTRQTAWRDGGE